MHDVVVIGAGLAGVHAASRLRAAGLSVCVVDKARGVGGRLATRRTETGAFDHGAQYFTARDPGFMAAVDTWQSSGWVSPWKGHIVTVDESGWRDVTQERRYVAVPGMSALVKQLAAGLETVTSHRIVTLTRLPVGWQLVAESGEVMQARQVVVATPPAQAAALLTQEPTLRALCETVEMDPCWAVMLEFDAPLSATFDGCFVNHGPLRWIARNSSKPGRPSRECWVLHASAEWTRAHLDDTPATVVGLLTEALSALTVNPCTPQAAMAHRWLYSQAVTALTAGTHGDEAGDIALAGDWLCGSRVEGAWHSGRHAAEYLLSRR